MKLNSAYIHNLSEYHDCDLVDIAKRRGIYASEVQDAILELSRQNLDVYTMVITDSPTAIEQGTDVIFATSGGNFVWYPDGEFELIENKDSDEDLKEEGGWYSEDGLKYLHKYRERKPWDYLRRGLEETYHVYEGDKETKAKAKATRESERNKYALLIKEALLDSIEDWDPANVPYAKRAMWINNRAHDLSLKLGSWAIDSLRGWHKAEKIAQEMADHLGIEISWEERKGRYNSKVLIFSIPYYKKPKEK